MYHKITDSAKHLQSSIAAALKNFTDTACLEAVQVNEATFSHTVTMLATLDQAMPNGSHGDFNIRPEQLAKVEQLLVKFEGYMDADCLKTIRTLLTFYNKSH